MDRSSQEPVTQMTRMPHKASHDRAELDALLDSVSLVHVGLVADEHPVVIPTLAARDQDRLLVHGSTGSRWMRHLASGKRACVCVTSVEAIVVARSLFESSYHYRSAVIFGAFSPLEGESKVQALDRLTEQVIPGRAAEVRKHARQELAATTVLSMPLKQWSLRVSDRWPDDPDEDREGDAWAGVVPVQTVLRKPVPAPDLREGIPVPASVARLVSP